MPAGVNPVGINFQFCHMFSVRAEILSPKRGDVMQSFVCGTRLCFGADAPAALAGLHAERVLLVTDPYFAENGTAAARQQQSRKSRFMACQPLRL